jgi:hypothetical protein
VQISSRRARLGALLSVMIVAASGVFLLMARSSSGQIFGPFLGSQCQVVQNACPACVPGVNNWGCLTPTPALWDMGGCNIAGVLCWEWQNFNCGLELDCQNVVPDGFNCLGAATLCRNTNPFPNGPG